MRLKQLKEPPLLNVVPTDVRGWWTPTSGERAGMLEHFQKICKGDKVDSILWGYYYLRRIAPQDVAPEHERLIRERLEEYRKKGSVYVIDRESWGGTIEGMKAIGLEVDVTDEDRKNARYDLECSRKGENGWRIMSALSMLKALGITVKPTEKDLEKARAWVDKHRSEPPRLLEALLKMKKAGIDDPITKQDEEIIKRLIADVRKRGQAKDVAWIFNAAAEVFQPEQEEKQPTMPPIKRYRG